MTAPVRLAPRGREATEEWSVRGALLADVPRIAEAVSALLSELGGSPPPEPDMEQTARVLVENRALGTLLVAESGSDLVGVLAASWQVAIHVPGRYGLIQDLWVAPTRRGDGIGAGLIATLAEIALANGAGRLEVGLPSDRFAGLVATESFYEGNGFKAVGKRMRMDLA